MCGGETYTGGGGGWHRAILTPEGDGPTCSPPLPPFDTLAHTSPHTRRLVSLVVPLAPTTHCIPSFMLYTHILCTRTSGLFMSCCIIGLSIICCIISGFCIICCCICCMLPPPMASGDAIPKGVAAEGGPGSGTAVGVTGGTGAADGEVPEPLTR